MIKRILLACALLILIGVGILVWQYQRVAALGVKPLQISQDQQMFEIKKGQSLTGVLNALEKSGLIKSAKEHRLYLRLNKKGRKIKAGKFRLDRGMSFDQAIALFEKGVSIQHKITFVEGIQFKDMLEQIHANSYIRRTMPEFKSIKESQNWVMSELGESGRHPEGLFLPETYFFSEGDSDIGVLKRARDAMVKTLDAAWNERQDNLKIKSKYEALILASIVEKETGAKHERPIISGVFHNRLEKGMKLQTDPTIIYGMGEAYKGDIRFKDLRKDTPYNTYTRYGLTPTPIALPGKEAILAAVKPAKTKALYFVSRNDGTHVFSNSLKQHNAAVNRYQRKR